MSVKRLILRDICGIFFRECGNRQLNGGSAGKTVFNAAEEKPGPPSSPFAIANGSQR